VKALSTLLLLALSTVVAGARPADDQWADGVAYTTDWDDALSQVRESGKLLMIYNGWERPDI